MVVLGRPRPPRHVEHAFRRLIAEGRSTKRASQEVGVACSRVSGGSSGVARCRPSMINKRPRSLLGMGLIANVNWPCHGIVCLSIWTSDVRPGREHDTTALRTHAEALPLLAEWTD